MLTRGVLCTCKGREIPDKLIEVISSSAAMSVRTAELAGGISQYPAARPPKVSNEDVGSPFGGTVGLKACPDVADNSAPCFTGVSAPRMTKDFSTGANKVGCSNESNGKGRCVRNRGSCWMVRTRICLQDHCCSVECKPKGEACVVDSEIGVWTVRAYIEGLIHDLAFTWGYDEELMTAHWTSVSLPVVS